MDFCRRAFLVFPAISLRRSHDDDFRRMEIGPAGARLATKRAVAFVDEVRSLRGFDADLAAKAGELQSMQQHRHQEFIRCLNAIEAGVPAGKLIHAIADNYATHKHPRSMHCWAAIHVG
jgi:hypothetical protein